MSFLGTAQAGQEDETWMSVSDLFAGLMIVFLFVAVIYIRPVLQQREQVREVAVAFDKAEAQLAAALREEFDDDLDAWGAEIDAAQMLVRFKAPEVLFERGSDELTPEFQAILADFFPRYASILARFEANVEEVRIEGHTSSDWARGSSEEEAFFGNMALSQARTRSVLVHALATVPDDGKRAWLRTVVTANGLSSSRPVMLDEEEDRQASRRVEFRVRTDAKREMVRILETLGGGE